MANNPTSEKKSCNDICHRDVTRVPSTRRQVSRAAFSDRLTPARRTPRHDNPAPRRKQLIPGHPQDSKYESHRRSCRSRSVLIFHQPQSNIPNRCGRRTCGSIPSCSTSAGGFSCRKNNSKSNCRQSPVGKCRRRSRPIRRRLCLLWGAHSVLSKDVNTYEEMVDRATKTALTEEFARPSQHIVVVAGIPFGETGSTNNLRVVQIR